jgi:hypothetical protein
VKLFEATEVLATKEHKRAVLVLHPKGVKGIENYAAYVRVRGGELDNCVVQIPLGKVKSLIYKPLAASDLQKLFDTHAPVDDHMGDMA